jgi:hypothetical protein
MNANELIEDLEDAGSFFEDSLYLKAAIMLRQQANRISELEKLVHQRFDDGKRLGVLETENKFKSPPCAWMVKTNDGKKLMLYGEEQPPKFADEVQVIPLYTHPVKELTDEEIEEVINQFDLNDGHDSPFYPFARAILRKASEK